MPELPEVETTRRGISPYCEQQQICALTVRQAQLRWPIPADLAQKLVGQSIERIERRGKYLLFILPNGTLLVHLGMSGSLRVMLTAESAGKHDHVDIVLASGATLRYHDPRRFGAVLWTSEPISQHKLLVKLGPEPLSERFTADYLLERCRNRRTPIKSFIMDSHVVVGVGNIYANEALFLSGIHPQRLAGTLSTSEAEELVLQIRQILAKAITQGGTTLRDFVGGDGKPGYFAQQLNVYGKSGQNCVQCSNQLQEIRQNNRSTVFCPQCQPLNLTP